jgi:hypothetical protein
LSKVLLSTLPLITVDDGSSADENIESGGSKIINIAR